MPSGGLNVTGVSKSKGRHRGRPRKELNPDERPGMTYGRCLARTGPTCRAQKPFAVEMTGPTYDTWMPSLSLGRGCGGSWTRRPSSWAASRTTGWEWEEPSRTWARGEANQRRRERGASSLRPSGDPRRCPPAFDSAIGARCARALRQSANQCLLPPRASPAITRIDSLTFDQSGQISLHAARLVALVFGHRPASTLHSTRQHRQASLRLFPPTRHPPPSARKQPKKCPRAEWKCPRNLRAHIRTEQVHDSASA